MPLPVSNLTPDSSPAAVRTAIDASYSICMKEGGKTPEQCGGEIYGIAEEKTGKSLKSQQ